MSDCLLTLYAIGATSRRYLLELMYQKHADERIIQPSCCFEEDHSKTFQGSRGTKKRFINQVAAGLGVWASIEKPKKLIVKEQTQMTHHLKTTLKGYHNPFLEVFENVIVDSPLDFSLVWPWLRRLRGHNHRQAMRVSKAKRLNTTFVFMKTFDIENGSDCQT